MVRQTEPMQPTDPGRRKLLSVAIAAIQSAIAGTLGVLVGGSLLSSRTTQEKDRWLRAAPLSDLSTGEPLPVMLRLSTEDGYARQTERRTVFLVKSSDEVLALDSTCTHLGCRVSWNAEARQLKCPCHGGVYDLTGRVIAGPPPKPLAVLHTRVSGGDVYVRV